MVSESDVNRWLLANGGKAYCREDRLPMSGKAYVDERAGGLPKERQNQARWTARRKSGETYVNE